MSIDEPIFRPILITKGRKTGREHRVELRAVSHNGKVYFSRHRPDSDWFKNAITNPTVKIQYKNKIFIGTARRVIDEKMDALISELKYPGEERSKEKRVTIEVTFNENLV